MNLIKWNPWSELSELDSFFDKGLAQTFTPALDVYDRKDHVVVESPIAGIDPNKINISIENDVLTIEGSMEKKSEVEEKNYYRKEVRRGSFHRSVALPTAVDGDKAEADYQDGVLTISIPKAERAKPKTIKVKTIK